MTEGGGGGWPPLVTLNSSTSRVAAIAKTPSLNISSLPVAVSSIGPILATAPDDSVISPDAVEQRRRRQVERGDRECQGDAGDGTPERDEEDVTAYIGTPGLNARVMARTAESGTSSRISRRPRDAYLHQTL